MVELPRYLTILYITAIAKASPASPHRATRAPKARDTRPAEHRRARSQHSIQGMTACAWTSVLASTHT